MIDDMSLEDVAKVLNEHGHKLNKRRPRTWGECDSCSDCVSNGLFHYDMFEGRAIAREHLRLDGKLTDVGPATRAVIDAIIYVRKCYRADRQLIVQCSGSKHVIPGDVVDAFLAEHEAKS